MKATRKALLCVEKSIINSVFLIAFFLVFGVKSLDKERKIFGAEKINSLNKI